MRARDNPFRSEVLLRVPYQLCGATWTELLERAGLLRYRAAIIGRHGSGKTTLLESLQFRLEELGFGTRLIRLDEEHRTFERRFLKALYSQLTSRDIILLDGAEQMNALSWYLFCRRTCHGGGLIITMHRTGRLPTLWQCSTSPRLLGEIAAGLLNVEIENIQECATELYWKHRGNLREALREWYDLFATCNTQLAGYPIRPTYYVGA
jgi:hypothetical protein